MARPSVQHTTEFDRISALPRRVPLLDDAEAWAVALGQALRKPGAAGALRPWQAFCAAEAAQFGGGFFGLPVGFGKTLLFEAIAALIKATRAVLIVPASLREKTFADRAEIGKVWALANPPPVILTRKELELERNADLLERLAPELIMIDECDEFANSKASATKRIDRYVVRNRDRVTVVAGTGTVTRKSIMGYWHILHWCIRDAPLPNRQHEARLWAAALDDLGPNARDMRVDPGPLGVTLSEARQWYLQRLSQTPGVVLIDGDSCEQKLHVHLYKAREDALLDDAFERFLVTGESPNGEPITDPLSAWRLDSQIGSGLDVHYVTPPPEEWRVKRRVFAKFVRDTIDRSAHGRRPLDTEKQVVRHYAEAEPVREWLAIKDTFDGKTETVWLSDSAILSVKDWLASERTPGIVFVGSIDFGERLARETGLPYYGEQGRDANGNTLHAASAAKSIVVSWHANKRGFNLQEWSRALICQPPQSAKYLEQIFGRLHRSGQESDVRVYLLVTSGGTLDAFAAARSEARFAKYTTGMTQKLLRARIHEARLDITPSNQFRWARKRGKK